MTHYYPEWQDVYDYTVYWDHTNLGILCGYSDGTVIEPHGNGWWLFEYNEHGDFVEPDGSGRWYETQEWDKHTLRLHFTQPYWDESPAFPQPPLTELVGLEFEIRFKDPVNDPYGYNGYRGLKVKFEYLEI